MTAGTALTAGAQERGSAWGTRQAGATTAHWSMRPAEAKAAPAAEKPKKAPKPEPAKAAAPATGSHQLVAPEPTVAAAPAGSHWGGKKAAPEIAVGVRPVEGPARTDAAPNVIPHAARAPRTKHRSGGPAVRVAATDAPGRLRRPGSVALEWPGALAPHPVAAPAAAPGEVARTPHAGGPRRIELLWEATPSIEAPAATPQVHAVGSPTPAVAAKSEPSKPAPTGLERLSPRWPAWARIAIQYRGRAEYAEPLAAVSAGKDGYYLNRVRLQGTFVPASWLQFVVQSQDSQILGYNVAPGSKYSNPLDLRLGYAEIAVPGAQGFTIRGGRQELAIGEGRLVASSDWGNTNRTFDGVRVSTRSSVGKTDFFAVSPVVITPGRFDAPKEGEWLYGGNITLERVVPRSVLEWYALVRTQRGILSEARVLGDAQLVTFGSRAVVKLRPTLEANAEGAMQRGDAAGDSISAWAAHAGIAWTPAHVSTKPKLSAEYNFASGDESPTDGRRGTFDQLYASNHTKYGLIDAVGWRNLHDVAAVVEATPLRKVKVGGGLHHLALATINDGLYASSGSRVLLNRKATSRSIGWETDGWVSYAISKELSVAAGLGVLFAGEYLQQSSDVDRLWSPYVTWNVKF